MPSGVYKHKPMSEEAKKHLSDYWRGRKKSEGHRASISKSKKGQLNPMHGVKLSEDTLRKRSEGLKGKAAWNKGKKCPQLVTNWQGGKSKESHIIRHSLEYRQWRTAVFERDNYTCQFCGERGRKLNADHIKQFAYHPELRLELSNGRTLCEDCHKATPTYKRKIRL